MEKNKLSFWWIVVFTFTCSTYAVFKGPFTHSLWIVDNDSIEWDETTPIQILIGLNVHNTDKLEARLSQISDPRSSAYGDFLTAQEIAQIGSPTDDEIGAVLEWLSTCVGGEIEINQIKDLIFLKSSTSNLEDFFNTQLKWHKSVYPGWNDKYLRATEDIMVPEQLEDIIAFISVNSPIIKKKSNKKAKVAQHKIFDVPHLQFPDEEGSASVTSVLPPPGELEVFVGENSAIVRFCLYCWVPGLASPLCGNPEMPPYITFRVRDIEANFPAVRYDLPSHTLVCLIDPASKVPCNPLDHSTADCNCGAVIGPLKKYSLLDFSAAATPAGSLYEVPIGSIPNPMTLLDLVTPSFLRRLYKIPDTTVQYGSTMAVAEFIDEFYDNADLKQFFQYAGMVRETIPDSEVFGNNPDDESDPGGEAMLDIEYLMAIAPNATMGYYSVAQCTPMCINEDFLLWLFYIGAKETPEYVHSVSYGDNTDTEHNTTAPYQLDFFNRIDVEFVKLGLQGVTIVISSGDDGVCSFEPFHNPDQHGCERHMPEWPSSSPFVTSAGATQLSDKYNPICGARWSHHYNMGIDCTGVGEVVCSSKTGGIITTGGGFSDVYDTPWWQESHVKKFLQRSAEEGKLPTKEGFFNPGGRGYPDIAVHGALYMITRNASIEADSGTSASAPMFAAMVVLLNDMLFEHGLPALGFINPLLYYLKETRPEVFNDVTVGDNACRVGFQGIREAIDCNDQYFAATAGWDPASGLGSVNFDLLSKAVLEISKSKRAKVATSLDVDANPSYPDPVLPPYVGSGSRGGQGGGGGGISPFNMFTSIVAVVGLLLSTRATILLRRQNLSGSQLQYGTGNGYEQASRLL